MPVTCSLPQEGGMTPAPGTGTQALCQANTGLLGLLLAVGAGLHACSRAPAKRPLCFWPAGRVPGNTKARVGVGSTAPSQAVSIGGYVNGVGGACLPCPRRHRGPCLGIHPGGRVRSVSTAGLGGAGRWGGAPNCLSHPSSLLAAPTGSPLPQKTLQRQEEFIPILCSCWGPRGIST